MKELARGKIPGTRGIKKREETEDRARLKSQEKWREKRGQIMRYTTVIFDMDGTLLNTLDDIADGVNYILEQYGYPRKAPEEVRRALGNGAGRLMEGVLPGGRENPRFDQILEEYCRYYQAHCQMKTRAYDGISETLEKLKAEGVSMGIVSNKGDGAVKELARQYFSDCIRTAVGEKPGIRRKPWPDSVLEALRLLGGERASALYVGDSEVDYETAKNAGIDCALVSWGFRSRELLEGFSPNYLIDRPQELLSAVLGEIH